MPCGTGEAGACGSGRTMCSPVQTDSNPAASAACATRTAVTGSLHGPMLMPNRPNFIMGRSEEHTSELQSHSDLVCRLLLEKKKKKKKQIKKNKVSKNQYSK